MSNALQPPTKRSAHTALNSDDTEDESFDPVPSTNGNGATAPAASSDQFEFDEDDLDVNLDDLDDLDLDGTLSAVAAAPTAPKKKKPRTANPDAPKRVRKKAPPKPPEPKAYAPKPAFAETIDHLAHQRACAPCPLCKGEVKVMWFSTVMHLQVCVNDKCWFPFNLKGNDYWSKFGGLTTATTRNKFVPTYRKHAAAATSDPPLAVAPRPLPAVRAPPVLARAKPTAAAAVAARPGPGLAGHSPVFATNTHPAAAAAATAMMAHAVASAGKPPAAAGPAPARSAAAQAAARKLAGATVTAAGKTRKPAAAKSVSPGGTGRGGGKVPKSKSPTSATAAAAAPPPASTTQGPVVAVPVDGVPSAAPQPTDPGPAQQVHDDSPLGFLFGSVAAPATTAPLPQQQLPTPVVSPTTLATTPPSDPDMQTILDSIFAAELPAPADSGLADGSGGAAMEPFDIESLFSMSV